MLGKFKNYYNTKKKKTGESGGNRGEDDDPDIGDGLGDFGDDDMMMGGNGG